MNRYLRAATITIPAVLCLASATVCKADQAACSQAIVRYNSVLDDLSSTLRRYTECLSESQGKDDCSSEFRRLRSTQDDFETAVSAIRGDCSG